MSNVAIQFYGFENAHPERKRFHDHPRLSIRQAFQKISAPLPDLSDVTFYKNDEGIAACIHPYAGRDEPKLSYQFHPEHESVVIRRIHAGDKRRAGLGSAMISSQLPFWIEQGSRHIRLLAHQLSEGFYLKLGFTRTHMIPEYEWEQQSMSLPMQLDLADPVQRGTLDRALAKVPPLTAFVFRL